MPSLLHRQAEDPRHGGPRRQIPPQVRHAVAGRASAPPPRDRARASRPLLFLLLWLAAAAAAAGPCSPAQFDEKSAIARVLDGDTVILVNGVHVRLIGVDTPELGDREKPAQPGADAARDFLAQRLPPGANVFLHYDAERRDRHGRALAHVFHPGRGNVQEEILAAGLGTPLTVPPNLDFLDCYRAAAAAAMDSGLGLWGLQQYRPLAALALPDSARGYRIVRGTVSRRAASAGTLWLELDARLALRIERADLPRFRGYDLSNVTGAALEARGMIYGRKGQLRMRIRHPADLQGLPRDSGTAAAAPRSEEVTP
jgi:endonuclease YncB( thermonuclease family)